MKHTGALSRKPSPISGPLDETATSRMRVLVRNRASGHSGRRLRQLAARSARR